MNAETRSEASKQKWANPETRQRMMAGQRRYWDNPETRKQRGEIAKQALAPKEVRQRISDGTKKALADPEIRQKISESSKRSWDGNAKRREQAGKLATAILNDPKIIAKARAVHATPEAHQRMSEGNKRSWEDSPPERRGQTSKWAKQLWAERKARLTTALPPNWKGKGDLSLIIGIFLLTSPAGVKNEQLGLRLDAVGMKCDRNGSWVSYVKTEAGQEFMRRIRNWVGKPGKANPPKSV